MFNNLIRLIFLAPVFLVIADGCAREAPETEVKLDQAFVMEIGQMVGVTGEDFEITFEDITEDSRCPKGVVCVWAGQVSALLLVSTGEGSEKLTLTESGSSGVNTVAYRQYRISYQVTPYPEAGKQIARRDYRLQLTVSK